MPRGASLSRRSVYLLVSLALGALVGCNGTALVAFDSPQSQRSQHANTTLTILIPKSVIHARRRELASASTRSVSIAVNGGAPVTDNIGSGLPGCIAVTQGTQCTAVVQAPVGVDTFAVATFDQPSGGGRMLSIGAVTQSIVLGRTNVVRFTLDGIVASIALALQNNGVPEHERASAGVTVMADDADGNTIVGPGLYDKPIFLEDDDPQATTALSQVRIAGPSLGVTLTYDGGPLSSAGANALLSARSADVDSRATTNAYFFTNQVDWDTWGFAAYRGSYNPYETTLTPSNVGSLRKLWSFRATTGVFIAAPVVAGNVQTTSGPLDVLYVGDAYAKFYALNAGTGKLLWSQQLSTEYVDPATGCVDQPRGIYGIGSTAQVDRSTNRVYVVDGRIHLWAFDLGLGTKVVGPVSLLPLSASEIDTNYAGLMLDAQHHLLYAGVGAHCGLSNEGAVVQYNTVSGAIHTFWGAGDSTDIDGRDGVWGPGGVVLDPRSLANPSDDNVFGATADGPHGKASTGYPQLGSAVFRLSSTLVEPPVSYYRVPIVLTDEDFGGTPLVFRPNMGTGCSRTLLVAGNKAGKLFTFDADNLAGGPLQTLSIAAANANGQNLPSPAYDPNSGYVFVNNGSDDGNIPIVFHHGLLAFAVTAFCTLTSVWEEAVGPNGTFDGPPAPPTVANGVVYYADGPGGGCSTVGPGCTPGPTDLYAFNASTGVQLFHTTLATGPVFAAPVVANGHVYVSSWGGYGPGYVYSFGT